MGLTILNCTECKKDFLVSDDWLPITPNTPGYRVSPGGEKVYTTTRCERCFDLNDEITNAETLEDPDTTLQIGKI